MINETVSFGGRPVLGLGECPIIRPEGIYYGGRRVIALDPSLNSGLSGVGVGDVGDLLAYRQEWDPYIGAQLALWRNLADLLESLPDTKQCPPGIFTKAQIPPSANQEFCSSLSLARIRTSNTDPGGILTQWNAWKDKSSADLLAGASSMLKWHQDVVMRVGGPYTQELIALSKLWNIPLHLPDVPSFSLQQEIRARIEGSYISTKGVIELIGYSAGELLGEVHDMVEATTVGLTETAKGLPKTLHWAGIAAAGTAALVVGALIVYYVPRKQQIEPSHT